VSWDSGVTDLSIPLSSKGRVLKTLQTRALQTKSPSLPDVRKKTSSDGAEEFVAKPALKSKR
jgi:hypothetical protein